MSHSLFDTPISRDAPLAIFARRDNHPVSRGAIVGMNDKPVETNKFYSNLYLGSQTQGVWTLPYMLFVTKDPANWGLSVSHTDLEQLALGPDPNADPVQFYISPLGIRSFNFSATEFDPSVSSITLDSATAHSVNLNLHVNRGRFGDATKKIHFPLVQGMGFVTARYENLIPVLNSGVFYRTVTPLATPRGGLQKWRVILENGKVWIIYACPATGTPWLELNLIGNRALQGKGLFTGFIQVAKLSDPNLEWVIDSAAGAFPTTTTLSATVNSSVGTGSYVLSHQRWGQNNANQLLMYALPHHLASFDNSTASKKTSLGLQCPTKGIMWGVLADTWTLQESSLPTNISWTYNSSSILRSTNVKSVVQRAAGEELQQDMDAQSNLDSMYFSGKALGKFAQIVLALTLSEADPNLARSGLSRLKNAYGRFARNQQRFPLVYDRTWKGLVSDAMYRTGDPNVDFGNGHYNDHHFHYGYFIYTGAAIVYCDQVLNQTNGWLNENRAFVNSLVRDVANPSSADPYFPVTRAFDWFHGHSWAKGLFESADGKDQESTSEDYNFAYGLKMWGLVSGSPQIEHTGNLMLAIMKRSMNEYFLLSNGNKNHPARFIKNKVTGILFENKVDHATYFGMNIEYIQGIHMIPLTPVSPYVRSARFTREEWDQWFSNARIDRINSGWRGIIEANRAIFDPKSSWNFFTQSNFNRAYLDGGASLTWYLAFVAGLGGA